MKKDKTGVQLDLGHTSTDDFITEKYVLPLLRDEKMRNKLIEEHRACPVGKAAQPHKGQPMVEHSKDCLLYTSPSPRDLSTSRMPSSA